MKKITKKEFVETLKSNVTAHIVLKRKDLTESDIAQIKQITFENAKDFGVELLPRTVEKAQTNAVMFSNGSWLYFDSKGDKSYFRIGNTVLSRLEYRDPYNPNFHTIQILGYLVK